MTPRRLTKPCAHCGEPITRRAKDFTTETPTHGECTAAYRKGKPLGGRKPQIVTDDGYVYVWMPEHHLAKSDGYAALHRVRAEEKLGRELLPNERVYFQDGDRGNCALENLVIIPRRVRRAG